MELIHDNYFIDRKGKVYSKPRMGTKGGVLTQWKDGHGHWKVRLHKDGKGYVVGVHRLLAIAYIPNPENKPQINHKDGNPANNDLSNLEWCTSSENIRHAYETGLRKNKSSSGHKYIYWDKLTNKWRVIIHNEDKTKTRLGRYETLKEAIAVRDKHLSLQSPECIKFLLEVIPE